jgi:hypothetical protein
MMQSCASVAKLRGGGSNLHSGSEAMVFTSDHRHLGSSSADPGTGRQAVVLLPSLSILSLMVPDVRRCHPTLRPS